MMTDQQSNIIGFVLKGYPRLSETFIAQEILELEREGLNLHIFSLRPPREKNKHEIVDQIRAPVTYLPEYLTSSPLRVLTSLCHCLTRKNFYHAVREFLIDCKFSVSRERLWRFVQAAILAELADKNLIGIHAHFLHSPASVAKYSATILGLNWSCSAHAVDIWTLDDREKRIKLDSMEWLVTCTRAGSEHLSRLAGSADKVHLVYHGIDLKRFASLQKEHSQRNGLQQNDPVILLSVGRLVEKKGYDILLNALSRVPPELYWQFYHVGDGVLQRDLKRLADNHKLSDRITWLGSCTQDDVLELYRKSDIFVLPSRVAANGDRDGLPNVLMEAQSQSLACLTTTVSAIPELVDPGITGLLVPPDKADALLENLVKLIQRPELRKELGMSGQKKVFSEFSHLKGIKKIRDLLKTTYLEENEINISSNETVKD